ncbi:MAG: hypothetical protein GC151_08355 [Betaproteobacteria bacterium]|nr:hypothetical protein [Betaproteobacteria bacterium]
MQVDMTTFVLQIVNFLVLVWLLKRFLYRPVLAVIARRRAAIDAALGEARDAEARARDLRAEYETKLANWATESADAHAHLAEELAAERERRIAQIDAAAAAEQERNASLHSRREAEMCHAAERDALEAAAGFAARLLERLSGPELDERLVTVALEDLATLSAEESGKLREAATHTDARIVLTTPRPLTGEQRDRLVAGLRSALGRDLPCDEQVQPRLLGGVRIAIGPWLLAASLQDELAYFRLGLTRAG